MGSSYLTVICMDGIRKGRVYCWPAGTNEFQVTTVVPEDAWKVYTGEERLSGYGGHIYKVYAMWGSGAYVGYFQRLAYK